MATPPSINNYVFYSVNISTCNLYVPKGSFSLYSEAVGWSAFANIIEEEATAVNKINSTQETVYTELHDIVVKGARLGETIFVYTTSGMLVKTVKATN